MYQVNTTIVTLKLLADGLGFTAAHILTCITSAKFLNTLLGVVNQFVKLGKMLEDIRHGVEPNEAYKNNIGQYGRFDNAAKYIDPREE